LPQLPTLAEAGVVGYDVTTWYMLLAPRKTPAPLIEKIQKDVASRLHQPDVVKVLGSEGAVLIGSTPQEAAQLLKREVALWSQVIKEAGVKPTD
jgi:tripartite-type tricarboxylate transporter receptor subunit TctC